MNYSQTLTASQNTGARIKNVLGSEIYIPVAINTMNKAYQSIYIYLCPKTSMMCAPVHKGKTETCAVWWTFVSVCTYSVADPKNFIKGGPLTA